MIPLTVLFLALGGIYFALQSKGVQTWLTRRVTTWMAENLHVRIHIQGVDVGLFNRIILENVWLEDEKSDTLAYARRISAHLNNVSLSSKKIGLKLLTIDNPRFYPASDSTGRFNFEYLAQKRYPDQQKKSRWKVSCDRFRMKKAGILYVQATGEPAEYRIDDLNLRIGSFYAHPDSLGMHISSLSLIDSRGFFLNDLSADIRHHSGNLSVRNLSLSTLNSRIDSASLEISRQMKADSLAPLPLYKVSLPSSIISLQDVALFIPQLDGMDQKIEVSGKLEGISANLSINDIKLKTGLNSIVEGDIDLNWLPEMDQPYLFVDIQRLQTDFNDLSRIRLPNASKTEYLRFPEGMYGSGQISYRGNFTGFLTDFVAYGTINSKMGQIKSDLSFIPEGENAVRFKGLLETADFDLGTLLQSKEAGKVTFNAMVNGTYNKLRKSLTGTFDGGVSQIEFNDYNYQNIILNGKINNRRFDGSASIDDPNLNLNFAGVLNLNEKIPVFDFILNLKKADLTALNLDSKHTRSDLSLSMTANFSGNNIDNFDGLVQVYNGHYANQNGELEVNNVTINTHLGEQSSQVNITSDFLDAAITGTYHFNSLFNSFRNVLAGYVPVLGYRQTTIINTNRFSFDLKVKELNPVAAVFIPGLAIPFPFDLSGKIDSYQSTLELKGNIPAVRYKDYILNDIDINISPVDKTLASKIRVSEAAWGSNLVLYNLALMMEAADNHISSRIVWNNWEKLTYSGEIESDITLTSSTARTIPTVDIQVKPSTIIIADSVWQLLPSTVRIDSSALTVNNFTFLNNHQEIALDGKISRNREEILSLFFRQIDLRYIESYLKESNGLKGIVDGSVGISDFYGERLFFSDLKVGGFEFRGQEFGDISLVSQWDRQSELIRSDLKVAKNNRFPLLATGTYDPNKNDLDFNFQFDNQSLFFLNALIRSSFSNFHGEGTGKVRLHGSPRKILLDGAVFCQNAGLTIDFTQVAYTLSDSIRFKGDKLIFDRIQIRDITGNQGLFNGTIRHDNFNNMDYDLSVRSNKILAMNTTMGPDNPFFGKAIVRGNIQVTGHGVNVKLSGEATSLPETAVTIVLDDETEVARYDFVRFLTPEIVDEKKPLVLQTADQGGLETDFLIHATPEARVQLVYNTQISDLISAQGEGTLRFTMDKKGNITLAGTFTVEEGEYLFTLQDVINKRFTVESGGTLTWSGNPYEAIIDLNALYSLKASLYELLSGSIANIDSRQRIPVNCNILLTGELMSPDISFDISFPNIETSLRDELQQFFATQEDLNRQMLSLLVLGKFYTPEYVRGNYESATTSGLIGNTASDLFSNQLSNWLSQINKDVDVGVKYRPGNQMTNDEIELALSTQMFNDRVSINGNIANNANPRNLNNSELVGDFEVNVKLSRNGKLQLKFYNRSNNNLIYETAPYTQGLGVSYKEDYNTFGELLKKFISLFRKNED